MPNAWGRTSNTSVGLTVTEMIPGILEGRINALYILGEDPVMSDPDTQHIRHCLEKVDFLLLQEIFPSETEKYADILLPGTSFAEKTGTFTNTERRVQMVRQAIDPLGQARPDWQIISDLAKRLLVEIPEPLPVEAPFAGWDYPDTDAIMSEINLSDTFIRWHYPLPVGKRSTPSMALPHDGSPRHIYSAYQTIFTRAG